jgi:preprotein translocase subunit SecG
METLNTILSIIQVILAVGVTILILMQQGKRAGLSGAIGGGAETFFGKNKASSMDAKLNRITVVLAVVLCVTTLLLNIIK